MSIQGDWRQSQNVILKQQTINLVEMSYKIDNSSYENKLDTFNRNSTLENEEIVKEPVLENQVPLTTVNLSTPTRNETSVHTNSTNTSDTPNTPNTAIISSVVIGVIAVVFIIYYVFFKKERPKRFSLDVPVDNEIENRGHSIKLPSASGSVFTIHNSPEMVPYSPIDTGPVIPFSEQPELLPYDLK